MLKDYKEFLICAIVYQQGNCLNNNVVNSFESKSSAGLAIQNVSIRDSKEVTVNTMLDYASSSVVSTKNTSNPQSLKNSDGLRDSNENKTKQIE